MTAEVRVLLERVKVTLPGEAVTYSIATQLGHDLEDEVQYSEAKVFYLAALERRKRVHGDVLEKTLDSLNNLGVLCCFSQKDYEGGLDYYQQALRGAGEGLGQDAS